MGQRTFDLMGASETTGSVQVRVMAPPRWTLTLVQPERLALGEAALWKALQVGLRGAANVLAAHDPLRPLPLGTLRGTPTLAAAAAEGDTTATLACGLGQAGATLVAGDWLQFGSGLGTSQMVMLMADAVVDGAGNCPIVFEAPLRAAMAAGTAVTWNKPLAYYRRASQGGVSWRGSNHGMLVQAMVLEMLETWQ